jgi:hypothetical protein
MLFSPVQTLVGLPDGMQDLQIFEPIQSSQCGGRAIFSGGLGRRTCMVPATGYFLS